MDNHNELPASSPNGWREYQNLVLHELRSHSTDLKEIRKELQAVHTDIAMLKVKAGVWGGLGGLIGSAIVVASVLLGSG